MQPPAAVQKEQLLALLESMQAASFISDEPKSTTLSVPTASVTQRQPKTLEHGEVLLNKSDCGTLKDPAEAFQAVDEPVPGL